VKPYYERDGIVIYHGDCREVLPALGPVDLVLTDPPYGIEGGVSSGVARGKGDYAGGFVDDAHHIREVVVPVIEWCIENARCVVLTPGNRCFSMYPQPQSFGAFYQPAAVGMQAFGNLDAQPIFYYGASGGSRMGKPCSYMLTEPPEHNGHPCPKPLRAWRKLLAVVGTTDGLTLDPFMGSGTTLRAAKDLGRKAIGIEIEERYCEIAAKRLSQEVMVMA
jgi:site-specific DNA-methyltransferase (adenine-specific)